MLVSMIHTLCCVATRSILHENVVERLVCPIGQLVNPHGGDPLLTHGALWVPAVDHTVITRPSRRQIKQDGYTSVFKYSHCTNGISYSFHVFEVNNKNKSLFR